MNISNIESKKIIIQAITISQIKIPMIQRDYVQGLHNDNKNNYKLDRFLDVLYDAINSNNNEVLSLDFIYGNIDNDGRFEPIDGQQRLTTLALLTFYLYCRQNNSSLQNPFRYITYATRQSAEKFCELLRDENFIQYFKNKINQKNVDYEIKPSNIIKNYNKYFKEYNEDTTIISMINTLDKIHEKFHNIEVSKYKNINKIDFNILSMDNFNLSDDLYIKMNGRGKQLSSFENFKAEYFQWLENEHNTVLIPDNMNIETLKNKFNTDYIDIFWDFAVENNNGIPDPEKLFFRFINRFIVGKYLLKNNKDNNFEVIFFQKGIKAESDDLIFTDIKIYSAILQQNNHGLINILENLIKLKETCSKSNENFREFLTDIFTSSWGEKIEIFKSEITNTNQALTFHNVLIFNSIISYFEKIREFSDIKSIKNTLKRIARIVWNIAEQFNIYTAPTLINRENYHVSANKLSFINNLKDNCIYNSFISEYESFIKHFDINDKRNELIEKIIYDEFIKCKIIINNDKDINNTDYNLKETIENKLISLESLDYLHGTIGFLLLDNNINFNNNYECYFNMFNDIKQDMPDKYKTYNINNSNKLLVRLLVYELYRANNYTIYNKYFSDNFIKKELIGNIVFKKNMFNLIIKIIQENYQFNLPKIDEINISTNALNKNFNPYLKNSIIALLYDKIENKYVINDYYIDTSVTPCIEHNKYLNKPYKKYKRLGSIIVEQHVCDLINYIITKDTKFNQDEKPGQVNDYSCEDGNKKRIAYRHLIYYNNGHLIIYFYIGEKRYSVWFIYQDNQIGITDETDQNNKKELKKQYSNDAFNEQDFITDIESIKKIIDMLVDDKKTLAELYNDEVSNKFHKR